MPQRQRHGICKENDTARHGLLTRGVDAGTGDHGRRRDTARRETEGSSSPAPPRFF